MIKFTSSVPNDISDHVPQTFFVRLKARGEYFGEFMRLENEGKSTFDIGIISLGYGSIYNVGNPVPTARAEFTDKEITTIQNLLNTLLHNPNRKPYPIKDIQNWTGKITYDPNWIRRK